MTSQQLTNLRNSQENPEEFENSLPSMSIAGRLLFNLQYADDADPLGDTEEELQSSLKGQRKQTAAVVARKSALTKAKFSSTASSPDHLPTYG